MSGVDFTRLCSNHTIRLTYDLTLIGDLIVDLLRTVSSSKGSGPLLSCCVRLGENGSVLECSFFRLIVPPPAGELTVIESRDLLVAPAPPTDGPPPPPATSMVTDKAFGR